MTTLTTHQRELLQAVLDGKELVGVVSGTAYDSQDLLHAIARQPTSLKIKTEDKNAEVKMNTMKDILQAIIEGKQLLTAGGSPIDHKTALNYLSRGLTVTIRPETVHRFVPVFKMPAGSVYMSEAKVDLESAKNPGFNGKTSYDKLAGVLHVEIEPTTMTLVKVEMVMP